MAPPLKKAMRGLWRLRAMAHKEKMLYQYVRRTIQAFGLGSNPAKNKYNERIIRLWRMAHKEYIY